MKIAIFHNFMDNIGGAEMVSLTLARELGADIFTTNICQEAIIAMGFSDLIQKIKSIGKIPKKAPFRHQLAFWRFKKLNLEKQYDLYIISGDWAMSSAVNNKPNLWYVHAPLNEIWQFKNYVRKEIVSWWKKPIFEIWVRFNRILTIRYSKHVDIWVCNSKNTQGRIKKYYGKDATIINPPIYTKNHSYSKSGDYWLSVNRLVVHKRVQIQTEAFRKMKNEKLVIIGSYEKETEQFENYKSKIINDLPSNVEILHWVDDDKKNHLYSNCKGFITTAMDEDFGMTVVEAMASGKPIIAPNEGGYKETVINNVTGLLIDNINPEKLVEKMEQLNSELKNPERQNFYRENSQKQASKFDVSVFIEKINKLINSH